jgi:DNA-binding response OmpR family regulator
MEFLKAASLTGRVFLFDDGSDVVPPLHSAIRAAGYEVSRLMSSDLAVAVLRDGAISVCVWPSRSCDDRLVESLNRLRISGVRWPVLVLLTRIAEGDATRIMAAGGDEVLDSSDGPQLVDRIATYLRTLCRISTGVYCGGILRMERSRLMVHVVKEAGIVGFSLPPKQFDALQLLAEHDRGHRDLAYAMVQKLHGSPVVPRCSTFMLRSSHRLCGMKKPVRHCEGLVSARVPSRPLVGALLAFCVAISGCKDRARFQPLNEGRVLSPKSIWTDPGFGYLVDPVEIGGHLWVSDALRDPFLHILDTASGRVVRSFGRRGQGPSEFEGALGVFRPIGTDSVVLVFDSRGNRLTSFSSSGSAVASSILFQGPRVGRIYSLRGGKFIGRSIGFPEFFAIYSPKGSVVATADVPWLGIDSVTRDERQRILNGTELCTGDASGGFALAYQNVARVELYDSLAQFRSLAAVPSSLNESSSGSVGGRQPVMATHTIHYLDCAYSSQHLFALYSGTVWEPGRQQTGNALHIFDLQGRLVTQLRLSVPVAHLHVDPAATRVFAVSADPPGIVHFLLPRID